MILKVLASGSKGNSYALINNDEILLIEAGVSLMEVKKNIDFMISKVVGCVVTHVHLDHSKYVAEYLKHGIDVYVPASMYSNGIALCENLHPAKFAKTTKAGGFKITPFECVHDVECLGYLIKHNDIGKLLFATDTEYIRYKFQGLNHIMIEANYSYEYIKDAPHTRHIIQGHMEIGTTCEFLKINNNPELKNVLLMHLSDDNGHADSFKKMAEKATDADVYIAKKGLNISMEG